jgi:hypothetical protein
VGETNTRTSYIHANFELFYFDVTNSDRRRRFQEASVDYWFGPFVDETLFDPDTFA